MPKFGLGLGLGVGYFGRGRTASPSVPSGPLISTANLLAYYNFQGNLADVTGNGNDLINSNAEFSSTMGLNGQNYYAAVYSSIGSVRGSYSSSTPMMDASQSSTISLWFRANAGSYWNPNKNKAFTLFGGDLLQDPNSVITLPTISIGAGNFAPSGLSSQQYQTSGIIAYSAYNNTYSSFNYVNGGIVGGAQFTLGSNHNVVYIGDYENNTLSLYLDGVLQSTVTCVNDFYNASTPPQLGDSTTTNLPTWINNGGSAFYVDEVAVWQRAISASEVAALYNSGAGRFYNPTTHAFA